MLKLIIEDDEGRKTVVPFVRDEITIGRQEGNTIRLTERNVSRRHARLVRQNGHVLVEDLGSYNGIRINGDKIQGQVPVHEGDLIQIGDYDLAVQSEQTQAQQAANGSTTATSPILPVNAGMPTGELAPPPPEKSAPRPNAAQAATVKLPELGETLPSLAAVSDAGATLGGDDEAGAEADDGPEEANPEDVQSASGESETARRQSTAIIRVDQVEGNRQRDVLDIDPAEAPRLVVLNTEFAGREFACIRSELRIGRVEDNDIALDHRSLSRTHCKVVREDSGEWRVIDMQSANGLTVNGEPYAQSALRTGDTLELGHVKFKFVGPGETFTLTPSADGVQVRHSGGSKAPLVAGLVVALVALAGAGYWFVLRKKIPTTPVRVGLVEPVPPPIARPVEVVKPPEVIKPPEVVKPPEELTPEEQNKERAKKLAAAAQSIEQLDWKTADEILKTCFVGESPCPEATRLIGQMNQERSLKLALEKGEAALDAKDLMKAKSELDMASSTRLLNKRYQRAVARLREATSENLKAAPPKPVEPTRPVEPPPPVAPVPRVDPAVAFLEEGRRLMKDKQYPGAKTQFEKCVKVAPKNPDCHKMLGAAWAKLNDPDKGAKEYREFVRLAPPDHPDLEKIRNILMQFDGK